MKSNLFNINLKDLLKGAVLAFLTSIATGLYHLVDLGEIQMLFEWAALKPILLTGLGAFLAYLLKNFITNSDDKIL